MYVDPVSGQHILYSKNIGIIAESTTFKKDANEDGAYQNLPTVHSERGDPWDILALALFTAVFASLSVSFSALGLHVFMTEGPEARQ